MADESPAAVVIPNLPVAAYLLFEQRCLEAGLDPVTVLQSFFDEAWLLESLEEGYRRVVFNCMVPKANA